METGFEEIERLKRELEDSKKMIASLEYDDLTGLLIRQAFLHRAEAEIRNNPNKNYGILALDFENFKSANSLYGEEKCNEFLAVVSHKLAQYLPNSLIGRFGGDQFVLLFESDKDYMNLIDSYKTEILQVSPIPNQVVKFGIYNSIDRNLLLVRCCDRAFLAIHSIKGVYGQNIAFYDDSMQQHILDEHKIVESMEAGLEQGQFLVYYQPKHESVTDKIAGAEALVRWLHPVYGFMNPGQFIPLFERNGFISKLDTYILETVCKDINRWKQQGLPLVPVSVNISRHDYIESNCIENQLRKIDEYGIDHNLIHIEVTESMYSDDTNIIVSKVRNTQERGFLIEMDDFGAGYSSLGSLASIPLDVLKLDISFVRNLGSNKIIIENIIKMAHRMNLVVVAEGVESEMEYKILRGLGCDLIQGFYFSKPLPVNDFESYIRRHSTAIVHKNGSNTLMEASEYNEEKMLMLATEVAEGIPGGFLSCHVDNTYQLISINRQILEMFDCESLEEFRNYYHNSVKEMFYPGDFEDVDKKIHVQLSEDNSFFSVDHRILTKKGVTKYARAYGRFLKTNRYGDIFYVFMYDMTEEIHRKELAEKQKAEQMELEKSAEIATITSNSKSIFMKNFLNSILPLVNDIDNNAEGIRKNLDSKEKINEYLKEGQYSLEKFLAYINNLQEILNKDNEELVLTESPSDLTQAIDKISAIFKKEAEAKNIKLESWSKIYSPYVYQDVKHTTDVVFNILGNAIKYTPEGGTVRFGIEQTPGDTEDECNISFICEDTGIGISKEFYPHLYEPFVRENNEINDRIPSSGIGLNIAYNLLKIMKGTICIESEQGKYTKVVTCQPHRFARKEEIEGDTATLTAAMKK